MVVKDLSKNVLPNMDDLSAAVSPALASKQPGSELFLSQLVAEASLAVMPTNPKDFNVDSVRVVKVLGGGLDASRVVRGMVFGREPEGTPRLYKERELARQTLTRRVPVTPQVSSRRPQRPRWRCTLVVWISRRPRPRARCC
jgi:T-complex protein 1 subunit theta